MTPPDTEHHLFLNGVFVVQTQKLQQQHWKNDSNDNQFEAAKQSFNVKLDHLFFT